MQTKEGTVKKKWTEKVIKQRNNSKARINVSLEMIQRFLKDVL